METSHTMRAQELGRVLHNAALFASKDDARPILNGVNVSLNGKVEATATDSYVLGHDECPVESSTGETTVILDSTAVMGIARELLKTWGDATVSTADDGHGCDVTVKIVGKTWTLTAIDGEFPHYRQIIPDVNATGEVSTIGLNANTLARFVKVRSDASPKGTMRFRFFAPTKPVVR